MARRAVLLGLLGAGVVLGGVTAWAVTPGPPQQVHCPVDGTPLTIRIIKSRLRAPLGPSVALPRAEPVHRCPRCGFVGADTDYLRSLPAPVATRLKAWLDRAPVENAGWQLARRSAALAALAGADSREVAFRYLQAAALAPLSERRGLKVAARDALETVDGSDTRSRYAAAELSRQLGDPVRARKGFELVSTMARRTAPERRWALERLSAQGSSIQNP